MALSVTAFSCQCPSAYRYQLQASVCFSNITRSYDRGK